LPSPPPRRMSLLIAVTLGGLGDAEPTATNHLRGFRSHAADSCTRPPTTGSNPLRQPVSPGAAGRPLTRTDLAPLADSRDPPGLVSARPHGCADKLRGEPSVQPG